MAVQPLYAQDVIIKAELDRDSIMIGEQACLSLKATLDKSAAYAFPRIDTINNNRVEILAFKGPDTLQQSADQLTVQASWTITSFDAAVYSLPRIPFLVRHAGGKTDTLYSESLQLKVKTVPIDTTTYQAYDIKTPIQYPITLGEVLPYAGGGLLLVALIALIVYIIRQRQKNKPLFFAARPKDPPYVTALRELEKIKAEKLWQNNKVKVYYTRVTDVLRVYLEEQYHIQAMEKTSEEILQSVQSLDIPAPLIAQLREMFNVSDLVKFAKYQPEQNENELAVNVVSDFVYKTRPTEETNKETEKEKD